MPLLPQAPALIRRNLQTIANGTKASLVVVGNFTQAQFDELNVARSGRGLHVLGGNEIIFFGQHIHDSRIAKDGYSIDDVLAQIGAALAANSTVYVSERMSALRALIGRADGYGNVVRDEAIFEMTNRKPRAELFSVIPKGDKLKPARPQKCKEPTEVSSAP